MSNRLPPAEHRILICDELSTAALEIFRQKGFAPEVKIGMTEDQLVAAVPGCHALVVRSATKVTRRVIEASDRLRVVGRAGVGVDNVDCDAATERGIVVMNTPTGNTVTTAELAVALIVSLARHVPRADRLMKAGQWTKKGLTGTELTGKTLGVVGFGRIGRVVAERGLGLRMKVIAHDPFLAPGAATIPGVELVDLEHLLARADFVTLHVPFSDATKNLISKQRIALMKKGARLVNAARGGLVDEAALLEALEKGHLGGAALDVFEVEPPAKDSPLVLRDDVIATPHLGASSHEAQHQVAVDVADQICDFFLDGVANNAVNVPAVGADALRELAPWVHLAEKIGAMLAQVSAKPVRKLEMTIAGELAKKDARHVPLALLTGLLRNQGLDTSVNFVNAPVLARERGVTLFEARGPEDMGFQSSITVRASGDEGGRSHTVTGTILGRKPMIVGFDGLRLDLEPKGPVLITRHDDQPGVVGLLGTVLGGHRVNIRRIELGPATEMTPAGVGLATGILSLYEEPSPAVLTHLRGLEPVREVRLVRL
ncbi:MAG: phosphoglycerate dehydrogenase [Planctomycetota bacterium]|nr:phosphoglycerate dehydrogenase [Planctomycetota bacterium]